MQYQIFQLHILPYTTAGLGVTDQKLTVSKFRSMPSGRSGVALDTDYINAVGQPIQTKKSFKGYDVKLAVEAPYIGDIYNQVATSKVQVYFGNTMIVEEIISGGVAPSKYGVTYKDEEYLVEIMSSLLYPDKIQVWLNGENMGTFNVPTENPKVRVDGDRFNIVYLKYRIPFSCEQSGQYMLGVETFAGPQYISLYSTRYGVKSFCLDHPAIVTSSLEEGSTTTTEIYAGLAAGNVLNIPSDQTWTLFYIFYNDGSIPMVCPMEAYDVYNDRCESLTGIVYFCSEGTFSPDIGACAVTPDIKEVCEVGRFDTAQGVCIINYPVQGICSEGDYNSVSGKCEIRPETEEICPENYVYNPLSKFCEAFPLKTIICEEGFTYNPQTDLCERTVATEYLCNGTFNSVTKKCTKIVEPDIDRICTEGVLYQNPTTFVYSCIYEPDLVPKCVGSDYDENLDKCVYIPESVGQCRAGESYNSAQDICIYEPDSEPFCISGTYDSVKDACVISPNMDYLCIKGTLNEDKTACLIIPEEKIICWEGFTYDIISKKCVRGADNSDIVIICPEGSVYNSDKNKCMISDIMVICPEGSTYDDSLKKCVIEGEVIEPKGNQMLYILFGLVGLLIIIRLMKRS